ncbi:MAG: hypothetical protein HY071_04275 [Chloroflexi bacterium]|nr:hypothetical protein [Chloroflexota bacterium]
MPLLVESEEDSGPSLTLAVRRGREHAARVPDLSLLFWLFFLGQFFVPLYKKQARRERAGQDRSEVSRGEVAI